MPLYSHRWQVGSHDPPAVSFQLDISPSTFTQKEVVVADSANRPRITVTATSNVSRPVTIFTFDSLLHLNLSQSRHNFTCQDLQTKELVWMNQTKGPSRGPVRRSKNSRDDKYFVTLEPGVPYVADWQFYLAAQPLWEVVRGRYDLRDKYLSLSTPEGTRTFLNYLESGHSYAFSVGEEEKIKWWWYGTREDVLEPEGSSASLCSLPPSGEPIPVKLDAAAIIHVA